MSAVCWMHVAPGAALVAAATSLLLAVLCAAVRAVLAQRQRADPEGEGGAAAERALLAEIAEALGVVAVWMALPWLGTLFLSLRRRWNGAAAEETAHQRALNVAEWLLISGLFQVGV